ncbi:MAG: hypothetical protein GX299_00480 [Epulopiscium sp.]|nr:hypothetical protein [Candidatus Epulonipiscium sp.]
MKERRRISIHPLVVPTVFFFLWMGQLKFFLWMLLFVTIHEVCHCIVAFCFGAKMRRITLTPLGEQAEIKGMEGLSYWKRQSILLAGPLASFLLGFLLGIGFGKEELAWMNYLVGGFNMLPFMPMDGGGIALNFFGKRNGTLRTMNILKKVSAGFGYFLILVGCIQVLLYPYHISLLLIGSYFVSVNKKGYLTYTYYIYKELLHPHKKIMPIRKILLEKNTTLGETVLRMNIDYYFLFFNEREGELHTKSQLEIMQQLLQEGVSGKVWGE